MLQQLQVKRRAKRKVEGFSLLTSALGVSLVMNATDVGWPELGAALQHPNMKHFADRSLRI